MTPLNWLALAIAGLSGCASQASPGYQGVPLFSVSGTIINELPVVPADTVVGLSFSVLADAPTAPVFANYWMTVPTTGEFPSAFTLDIYTPPPPAMSPERQNVYAAGVYVVQVDATGSPTTVLGELANMELVYVTSERSAGSSFDGVFQGELAAGYHLIAKTTPAPTAAELARCEELEACGSGTAAYCEMEANPDYAEMEVPPATPLTITLDGLPCWPLGFAL